MRTLLALTFCLLYFGPAAQADPSYWAWYPHNRAYQPYGQNVKLTTRGLWVHRDGQISFARVASPSATMLDPLNSDERNGKLAYAAAYSAYQAGREKGTNRVEVAKGGRWKKRITTERGIVLLTDDWSNVAVRTPDGKWHVTDEKGRYAATSPELPGLANDPEMVASVFYPSARPVSAPARVETVGPGGTRETSVLGGGRMPASLASPVYAD